MFEIEWSETASAVDLCGIYLDYPQHSAAIGHACKRIDRILEHGGPSAGKIISPEGLARLQCEPLEVLFEFVGEQIEVQTVTWIGFAH